MTTDPMTDEATEHPINEPLTAQKKIARALNVLLLLGLSVTYLFGSLPDHFRFRGGDGWYYVAVASFVSTIPPLFIFFKLKKNHNLIYQFRFSFLVFGAFIVLVFFHGAIFLLSSPFFRCQAFGWCQVFY